ncbi:hypothetical protein P7H15_18705 [Paenibacillus larvae]|nr:hypothetical protein [Paenibacillus larvae]MDT2294430.1 hypothetical protein [Paenibacillus larvae]
MITLLMTVASMALAIYFTAKSETKGTLAVVESHGVNLNLDLEQYRVKYLDQSLLDQSLLEINMMRWLLLPAMVPIALTH